MMKLEERWRLSEAINRDPNRTNRQIAGFRLERILTETGDLACKIVIKVMKTYNQMWANSVT